MNIADFIALLDDELGLPLGTGDLDKRLDEVQGWDSVYLLRLMSILERRYGRKVSLQKLLAAQSLRSVMQLLV